MRSLLLSVYRLTVPEGFEWVVPRDDSDFETFRRFNGTRLKNSWEPVAVSLLRVDDAGDRRQPADLPWLGDHVLVLTSRAVSAIGALLETCGEVLPLACDDADLYVFNPLSIVDALDGERSTVVRFSSGRLMEVTGYVFRPDKLQGIHAFKLPEYMRGSLLVSPLIVDAVQRAGLRGTEFERVWEDDAESCR